MPGGSNNGRPDIRKSEPRRPGRNPPRGMGQVRHYRQDIVHAAASRPPVVLVSSGMPIAARETGFSRWHRMATDRDACGRAGAPTVEFVWARDRASNCYGLRPRIRSPRRNSMPLGWTIDKRPDVMGFAPTTAG